MARYEMTEFEWKVEVLKEAQSDKEAPDPRLPLFFTPSAASQAAGLAFLRRASERCRPVGS